MLYICFFLNKFLYKHIYKKKRKNYKYDRYLFSFFIIHQINNKYIDKYLFIYFYSFSNYDR